MQPACGETIAAGALLFQEEGNQEVGTLLRDRQEFVSYNESNLETLLDYYLDHEDERLRIVASAREVLSRLSFTACRQEAVRGIEAQWPILTERAQQRRQGNATLGLLGRTWQLLSGGDDPMLVQDLIRAVGCTQQSWRLSNALGVVEAMLEQRRQGKLTSVTAAHVAGHFRRTLQADGCHVVARLNLVEALLGSGQQAPAQEEARLGLRELHRQERSGQVPDWLSEPHFPPSFDIFRVEWERAGFDRAGNERAEFSAKAALLRWRFHFLLGQLTGELRHHYEAVAARPDLAPSRSLLGVKLAYERKPQSALVHLHQAVQMNPLDEDSAVSLRNVLQEANDPEGFALLVEERRRLAQCAGGLVKPTGKERVSIIILCCNEVEVTKLCVQSILEKTRPPYELILVDNGSTDGTASYLASLTSQRGPERLVVLNNKTNVGFARGCNQGLREARGRFVVFLNNDTVVTVGWLEGLIAWALHDWPKTGMVGPVTNYSRPPQQITVPYRTVEEMPAFAQSRRQEFAGKAVAVERLTGFCLLARSEVLEKVGGFDACYGIGFFEDDDLCVRVERGISC